MYKNHQWPCITYRLKSELHSLVFLLCCFTLSFYPHSDPHCSPYAHVIWSICSCYPFVDWFVPTDSNSLVPLLHWASSSSPFKAPVKHYLLWDVFSDLPSLVPVASFSEFLEHILHISILPIFVSYLCASTSSDWRPWSPTFIPFNSWEVFSLCEWCSLVFCGAQPECPFAEAPEVRDLSGTSKCITQEASLLSVREIFSAENMHPVHTDILILTSKWDCILVTIG